METLNQSRINHHWMEPLVLPSALHWPKSLHSWAENRIKDMTTAKTKWKFLRVHQNQTRSPTQFLCGCTSMCTSEGATTRGNTGLCQFQAFAKLWRKHCTLMAKATCFGETLHDMEKHHFTHNTDHRDHGKARISLCTNMMLYVKLHRNFRQKFFSVHLFIPEHTSKLWINLHLSCYFKIEGEDEPA